MKIAIVNGPNLNLLGRRNPQVYGSTSMEQVLLDIQRTWIGTQFVYFQSNHEGALIDTIQQLSEDKDCAGIVLNAGGYSHTSVALRDAVEYAGEQGLKVVEVHISDISQRESFRQVDLLTEMCARTIIGHGTNGYKEAIQFIIDSTR